MIRLAAALALAIAACGAPAFALAAAPLQTGTLPHGGTYFLSQDPASPSAALDVWFRAPDYGYGTPVAGLARVAATAAAAAKLASGRSLAELVAQSGGHLTIEAFPDIIGVGVVVPAADARRMLAALTAAYFAPSIDTDALHTAQSDATVLAVQQQYETGALEHALLFSELFIGGPAHQPPLPLSAGDVASITLGDVTAFAQRAFTASNAFVSVAGAVDPDILSAITDGSGPGRPDAPLNSGTMKSQPQPLAQSGAIPGVGVAWLGPPISDERAATALDFVADYLFRPGSGTIAQAIERDNDRVDLSGQFITLNDPGVMLVTLAGSDDARLQTQIISGVAAMTTPLDAQTFEAARSAFLYHLASDTQTAEEQAANFGWYAAEGAPQYAPGGDEYESIARSLDPQYVASIVRRYLTQPVTVRITPQTQPRGASS